ncbi:Exonuclease mut-7 [Mortierella alpina]|nr:Exonuclease mut-7 [Mortierella alpina]
MAILSFIKSSSSKNKVAVGSPSDELGSYSPKGATSKNHAKKGASKTKTTSEFKVSAMAYAISRSPTFTILGSSSAQVPTPPLQTAGNHQAKAARACPNRMKRTYGTATAPNRSTWSRAHKPSAVTHNTSAVDGPMKSTSAPTTAYVSPRIIKQAVADNNAFLLGQSLLTSFMNYTEYEKEQTLGNVTIIQDTIAQALRSHIDPPMFVINALITVGTVTAIKNLDADFELAISELLIASLNQYVQWRRDNSDLQITTTPSPTPSNDSEESSSSLYGFEFDPHPVDDQKETTELDDLIALEDLDDLDVKLNKYTQSRSRRSPQCLIEPQSTGSSVANLLNDDRDLSNFNDVSVLRPAASDLIDLSNWDNLSASSSVFSPSSTVTLPSPKPHNSVEDSLLIREEEEEQEDPDSSYHSDSSVLEVDLRQLDVTNTVLPQRQNGKDDIGSDLAELLEIFDKHFHPEKQQQDDDEEEKQEKKEDETICSASGVQRDGNECETVLEETESVVRLIQSKHQEKILAEISRGKNILQVYAALEVMEMKQVLLRRAKGHDNETYGSLLTNQLYKMRRFRECAIVTAKYLERDLDRERELLPNLLEMIDQDTIHRYVDDSLDACYRVLSHINHQLSFQFYYWGLVNPALAQRLQPEFSNIPPIRGAGKARTQAGLVEIAMGLVMRFDLESEQESFAFLNLFIKFCTVVSLLEQSQSQSPSPSPYAFGSSTSLTSSAVSSTTSLTEDCGSINSNGTMSKSKSKSKDYSLKANWRFFHVVLDIIKDSSILKQMTIYHCIGKRDLITAEFFAVKLGMVDYYHEKLEPGNNSSILPLASSSLASSSSSHSPTITAATVSVNGSALNVLHRPQLNGTLSSPAPPKAEAITTSSIYQLPQNVKMVFIDTIEQLDVMSSTLSMSTVVAMDTEWLPQIKAYEKLSKGQRTAVLQLACDYQSTIFIVDTIAFLEGPDHGSRLVEVLCELFCNMSTIKLAFDWDGDQDLLEATFPALYGPQNRLQNFIDLKFIWIKNRDRSSHEALPPSGDQSPAAGGVELESWSFIPAVQGMQLTPGGLSGLLNRICGVKLDKTQQCSNWEQRPLTEKQCEYAAADVWCILDIFAILKTLTLM